MHNPTVTPNIDWSYDRTDHYLDDLSASGPFRHVAGPSCELGWDDTTTPRTDKPLRFQAFRAPAPKLWKRPTSGRFWSQVA
jgi:hypothetical protein